MRRFTTLAALALTAYAPFVLADDVPAGAYTVDKPHTSLTFRVSHLGFSFFTARFTAVDAKLEFDPARLAASSVNVSIDPRSVASDNAPDGFLAEIAGERLLDAAKYPQLTFVSKSIEVT